MAAKRRSLAELARNFWVYRRLVAAAVVLGVLLWFILINNQPVTVYFPFGLGAPSSSIGAVILVSAAAGGLATALILTIVRAYRRYRGPRPGDLAADPRAPDLLDDRPPSDYAAKTPEGFSDAPWKMR